MPAQSSSAPLPSLSSHRQCRAFGTAEILVCLVIVAVICILTIPAVQGTKAKAKGAACMMNQKQLYAALIAHAADHQGYFPKVQDNDSSWLALLRKGNYTSTMPAQTNDPNKSINFCPATTVRNPSEQKKGGIVEYKGNYALNRDIAGSYDDGNGTINPPRDRRSTPLNQIAAPSQKLLLLDAGGSSAALPTLTQSGTPVNYIPGMPINATRNWPVYIRQDALHGRHQGRCNVVMVDGHIESWAPENFLARLKAWEP